MNKLAILGVPRSGTSWLSQIFNSHPDVVMRFQPLFSYEHKGRLTGSSSAKDINEFFQEIYSSSDTFALMSGEAHKSYPTFRKSENPTCIAFKETRYLHIVHNILNRCPDVKVIGIVRNPLATLASWMLAPKEFDAEWDLRNEWRTAPGKNQGKPEEFYGFDRWAEIAKQFISYQAEFPNQFKLVQYNHLKAEPKNVTANLFKHCGLNMVQQVTEFIEASQSRHDKDPYSVFRANASDAQWQKALPLEIVEEIQQELKNTPLQIFLEENCA